MDDPTDVVIVPGVAGVPALTSMLLDKASAVSEVVQSRLLVKTTFILSPLLILVVVYLLDEPD